MSELPLILETLQSDFRWIFEDQISKLPLFLQFDFPWIFEDQILNFSICASHIKC